MGKVLAIEMSAASTGTKDVMRMVSWQRRFLRAKGHVGVRQDKIYKYTACEYAVLDNPVLAR
jgi:hypothetical protein